ncbi:hypothetical protein ABW21_db0202797 [Orbilia brochopaga]|nr:hypothetical protein ABW21_db0202797 [Drechslerella brochopaga]
MATTFLADTTTYHFTDEPDLAIDVVHYSGGIICKGRALVTSGSVANASPVWRELVDQDGANPRDTVTAPAPSGLKILVISSLTESEDSDYIKAFLILFNIMHLQMDKVPKTVTYDKLRYIAIICQKYECASLVLPWLDGWVKGVLSNEKHKAHEARSEGWLKIAEVFSDSPIADLYERIYQQTIRSLKDLTVAFCHDMHLFGNIDLPNASRSLLSLCEDPACVRVSRGALLLSMSFLDLGLKLESQESLEDSMGDFSIVSLCQSLSTLSCTTISPLYIGSNINLDNFESDYGYRPDIRKFVCLQTYPEAQDIKASIPHDQSKQLDWSAFRDQLEMEIAHTSTAAGDRTNHDAEPKASYKSWKKKYRKLRHKFEGVMKRSDELFKQDLIATASIKRITEENNRLLDVLLELNGNERISQKHRQNVGTPTSITPPRLMTPDTLQQFNSKKFRIYADDLPLAHGYLVKSEPAAAAPFPDQTEATEPVPEPMDIDTSMTATTAEVTQPTTAGSPSQTSPLDASNDTVRDPSKPLTPPLQPADKLAGMIEVEVPEEPTYERGSTPPRFRETSPFLNPIEDEELPPGTIIHYHQEDSAFTAPSLPSASPTHAKFPAATNASIPAATTEEEHHWPRNPMSVYCWLRKYQPQVFLQDNEAPGGKERKKKAKRSAEDEEDEHRPGHGSFSPAEPRPKRGGTRISFIGGASEPAEGKVAAGTKRRRPQKDEGGDETPEKEPRALKVKTSSTKPPAAKKPRKSGVKKEED